ncbi:hypothetical protein O6H91_08G058200 [Diphasiastrum complanatum]|uniref:Uncharacterized protein n=2 Tax=Diphasiastrum complanatum TaxID=34168 RepID=A0ACC2CXY1_DIPCM|nr:hypothetical protein O6H91_08G057900 [Diphasiastrum complanatum]KAJ7546869.1 hypothetical protein O6H91_08G058200 [Diphasiastrum complanatum]
MMQICHRNAVSCSASLLTTTCPNHLVNKCGLSSGVEGDVGVGAVEDGAGKAMRKQGGMLQKLRVACEKIYQRRTPPELRGRQDYVRSEADISNVVERRIFHSMLEGHFENLPGKGKPLQIENNPYADPSEEVIYRVLAKNGFAPEWIELSKEIKFKLHRWRLALDFAWKQRIANSLGNDLELENKWTTTLKFLQTELEEINRKVLSYNLQAPFGRQIFSYKMEKELQRLQDEHERNVCQILEQSCVK